MRDLLKIGILSQKWTFFNIASRTFKASAANCLGLQENIGKGLFSGKWLKKRPEKFFSQKCSKVAVLGQFFVLKRLAALICPDSAAKGPKTAKMCKKAIFVKIVKTPIFRNLGCP